jgi:hypothetical protein
VTDQVDELFGEGGGVPTPRLGLVWGLLLTGLAVAGAGIVCTAAPGGILVLLAWFVVEREADRVESGYLPADAGPSIARLRRVVLAAVLSVVALFAVQAWLLARTDFYDRQWSWVITTVAELAPRLPPPEPPPDPTP